MRKRRFFCRCRGLALLLALGGFAGLASAGDWPQWLGPTRNCHASADSPALAQLPNDPRVLWRKKIGGGFSSPVEAAGKLVYFDEDGSQEIAHLLNAGTGEEIWRTAIGSVFQDEWGAGPRSTPLIDDNRVYVQSCKGEFRCLDLATGKIIWGVSFEKDFGVKFLGSLAKEGTASRRGNNSSPVVDGDGIIVPVGSASGATLVCFDKFNGAIRWKAGDDEAAYSSAIIATLAGVKQVVFFDSDALMGVERATGKVLWRVPFNTAAKRHAATPVIYGDTVIVSSQTIGLVATKIIADSGTIKAVPAWTDKALKINLSTSVCVGGFLYCLGASRDYVCVDARTGELKWQTPGFGSGRTGNASTISIGKNLLILTDQGELVLIAANPGHYEQLSRIQICGKNWNFPAFAGGKLYVRDARQLACFDLLQ